VSRDGTLLDVLFSAVRESPDQLIVQVGSDGGERARTYRELLEDSLLVAGGLQAASMPVGTPVIVLPGDGADFLPSFWGALAAGLTPVPLAPVPEKVHAVWEHLQRPPVIVDDMLEPLIGVATAKWSMPGLQMLNLASLRTVGPTTAVHHPRTDDVAFLQFSSGSTGAPKGVELTHANVLANIAQAQTAGAATASDVIVTWLPYFHDMGLIGAHLTPLAVGIKQVKLDPLDFAKRPALWYETADRHRATLLPMASFALALTLKRVASEQVAALDLSSVRLVGVGSEPIPARTWKQFRTHMRPAALDPRALVPLYGLAEATLAVAFPPLGEVAEPLALDRRALAEGRAVDAPCTSEDAGLTGGRDPGPAEFMDVGYAVPGGELRVVDDDGEVVADSVVGHIEFRGPNVAGGYHRCPEETAQIFVNGWLRTGDLGFLRFGRLCVTGRAKDVLFVNGQKFHAPDIEQVVAATPGVPTGRVAVVGSTDPDNGAERIDVFLSSRHREVGELVELLSAVRARVRVALGYPDVRVLPIPGEDFPRTTSGKIQRSRLREQLAAGAFASLEVEVARVSAEGAATSSAQLKAGSRGDVEVVITDIWAQVLEVPADTIGPDDRFLAIGGSSLAAMQVLTKLEDAFGGPLNPAVLRDCATVAALTDYLLGGLDLPQGPEPGAQAVHGGDSVAVIALACRLPDADTPEAFWESLLTGRDSVTEVPDSRWSIASGTRVRWGAFLDDVAGFDADYFGVEARDAAVMDPHARIFLEVAHEALERAGYAGGRRKGRQIGVFVAMGESGYPELLRHAMDNGLPPSPAALVGNLRNLVAARVAHHLDLSGPAMVVDTACSSSLVALHLARRSLDAGECDVAVVGGVHLNLTATSYQLLEAAQAVSPTGRCRAFSAGADGLVPGEGAAAVVLEPLAAARAAADPVLAVIRGSAINNDGRSLSLMAPNPLLQEAVIAAAYRDAGIDPATVSYVEAHGTGTAVGDPIEARSLMRTFPSAGRPRWLGSVKTNVGHLLNAAGMPSLLKVVLSLHHHRLPPSLHYAEPSPEFDLASAGFTVVTQPRSWNGPGPLRAGINSFGFGGTNAHVIVEESPVDPRQAQVTSPPLGPHLLTLSAASEEALRAVATDLARHVRRSPGLDEGEVCHTASTARDDARHRLAVVAEGDLAGRLEAVVDVPGPVGTAVARRPRVVYLFPGQGSQVPGMGVGLHASQPAFRDMLEELSEAAGAIGRQSLLQWSLDVHADPAELAQTAVAQPLLVAFGVSLAHQLRAWGIRADAVLGHSVGELAAAAAAGAMSPIEAVGFAVERGRVMQESCNAGAMAGVIGAESDVLRVIDSADGQLCLAAVNGPSHFVISGTVPAVDAALAALTERGCRGRRLGVSHAFHSAMMDPALEPMRTAARRVSPRPEQTRLLSTVTGEWTPTFDVTYLAEHARRPVRFGPAVERLLEEGYDTFVELGHGSTLTGLVRSIAKADARGGSISVLPVVDGTADAGAGLLKTVGRLWTAGVAISRPDASLSHPRVDVPTYPFQRKRHWLPDVVDMPSVYPSDTDPVSGLLHRFTWKELPLPAGAVLHGVCIVGGDDGMAGALADRLARRGVEIHRPPEGRLHDSPPSSVIVLLLGPAVDLNSAESLDGVARDVTTRMLEVCRHLDERPTPLIVVTEDVAVTDTVTDRPRPGQAIAAGLAMALPDENPRQAVRVVDLSSMDDASDRLDAVIRELDAPPQSVPAESVAWRRGRRLARVPLMGEALQRDRPAALPADGRYLITGGAGGIGAAIAAFLARRGHPEIFLAGRSPECRTGVLHELQELGATAHYVPADLSLADDVDRLVGSLPTLDGVFHAAGLAKPAPLRSTETTAVETVLAPKVRGTFLLSRALERLGRRPETFVAISSIASAAPGHAGGLGAYAAANAFLDAFAVAESAARRPIQALNFAAWDDTGMASSPLFAAAARRKGGVPHLSREQAVRAMYDATTVNAPQLLVIDNDPRSTPVEADSDSHSAPAVLSAPSRPVIRSAPGSGSAVRDVIAGLIAPEIGQPADEIDDQASFLAMGLDSLTAVDLVKKLEDELGLALPTTLLFEYPSIAELSAYLSSNPAVQALPETDAPGDDDSPFGLTPVQLAFYTTGRLHPELGAYASVRLTLVGELDDELLARSLVFLEQRHPMLRVRLRSNNGHPRQVIEPHTERAWPEWFEVTDLEGSVEVVEDAVCNRVFDLAAEPPIRAALVREGPERAQFVIVVHHAAADGASLNLLCEELWKVYTALSQGRAPELPPLDSDFRGFVRLTDQLRTSEAFAADSAYWRHRLASDTAAQPGSMRCDGEPSPDPAAPLKARQFAVPAGLTEALRERAADLDVSLFHLVLSAYVWRLSRWSGRAEITLNVAHAGREARLQDINRLVGPFADTLPLTVAAPRDEETACLPHSVRDAWLDSMRHASVSTLDLARALPTVDAAPRTAGEASFSFARFPPQTQPDCPVRITATAARTASAATRLGLVCWQFEDTLQFSWNYPAQLFSPATIHRFTDEFLTELTSISARAIPPAPQAPGVTQRIQDQCRRTPNAVAVQTEHEATTYAQLDDAARRLAQRLHRNGIGPNDRVALLSEPGEATVAGVLGILYAGAAWVPLDSRHPEQRLADQVARAATRAVVCHQPTHQLAGQLAQQLAGADVIDLDDASADEPPGGPLAGGGRPHDDAYVIFTSGTTGRPKGIPITHRAMTTYLDWAIVAFEYNAGDRMAATASICFDASVRQILAPLLVGATIVVISRDALRDPQALLAEVERARVTVWSSVPTLWGELLRAAERRTKATGAPPDLSALRWIHVGGEPLPPALVRRWFDLFGVRHRVVNLYGPTEATINATYEVIDSRPGDDVTRIPIGRPVAETVVDVVDTTGRGCPPGEPGELLLAGPGLTAGYLDEPGPSADVFVSRAGDRYYRTGDRVLRRADGKLEFLGRTDQQMNIRGHRVEPGEIEAVLQSHPGVERAAVAMESTAGHMPRLIGYVQPRQPAAAPTPGDRVPGLGEHLATHLPDYMIPAEIRLVVDVPLTLVGKVDSSQLPDIATRTVTSLVERVGTPAVTATERLLADVWSDVLGTDPVFREDDFFALGGDSIAVLEVFARLEPRLPSLPPPTAMYQHRVLTDLARTIDSSTSASTAEAVHDTELSGPFPLIPAQRGFLLAEAMSPHARSSWVNCFHIRGPLDAALFQEATDRLVARHLMLRVVIDVEQRPPLQREMPGPCTIHVSREAIKPDELPQHIAKEREYRFDSSSWPLVRLHLLDLAPQEYAFLVHGHHAIADGYSVVILAQELMKLYDELAGGQPAQLLPLRSTFRDYGEVLRHEPAASDGSSADSATISPASYTPPSLRAPGRASSEPPATPPRTTFELDAETTAALNRIAAAEGATPYAPLLTAYYRALTRLTGKHDLLLGVAATGRDHALPDIGRIVGPCAHLVPVRVTAAASTFARQLRHISQKVTQARLDGATMEQLAGAPPTGGFGSPALGAQFIFSYLDFRSLGPITGDTLSLTGDRDGGDMEPPPLGTDLFLTARPHDDCLLITMRASTAVLTPPELAALADGIRRDLIQTARQPRRHLNAATTRQSLDAALVGYLPAPHELAGYAGIEPSHALRETVRGQLFPDGRPRLLEHVTTPHGRSGFVCLPLFSDELSARGSDALAHDTAEAVAHASHLGAQCVSLAGMIPAHTGYGLNVIRKLDAGTARVSTGHAATAASVVKTAVAALGQANRDVSGCTVASIGIGSIGRSSLELFLAQAGHPGRLVLCDLPHRRQHLTELVDGITSAGYSGPVDITCTDSSLPAEVYEADLIIAAVTDSSQRAIDIDRLRPGTIIVDDSFPHCFDPPSAQHRMERQGDILVVGGGLLACGPQERTPVEGAVPDGHLADVMQLRLPNTIASCQLESLLQTCRPQLPLVQGAVDHALARTYWDAFIWAGVEAAPLHLLHHALPAEYLHAFSRI
jgi:amino acid adenylation domain-containing protein